MRIQYLDAMRGTLMMLGVVLHAANIYRVDRTWEVNDPSGHIFFSWISNTVHTFRMPAFFMIAGFFAHHSYVRHETTKFVRERSIRLLIPFVTTLLTVNIIQLWIQDGMSRPLMLGPDAFVVTKLPWLISNGRIIQHLWFLAVLLVYCGILCAFDRSGTCMRPIKESRSRNWRQAMTVICCLHCATEVIARTLDSRLATLIGPIPGSAIIPRYMIHFAPYFIFGILLSKDRTMLKSFSKFTPATVVAVAALSMLEFFPATLIPEAWATPIAITLDVLRSWLGCQVCFATFRLLADKPMPIARYAADVSYSVYLFHHLLVIVTGTWLIPFELAPGTKFAIVCCLSLVGAVGIHELFIVRSRTLTLLFNGRVPVAEPAETPTLTTTYSQRTT